VLPLPAVAYASSGGECPAVRVSQFGESLSSAAPLASGRKEGYQE